MPLRQNWYINDDSHSVANSLVQCVNEILRRILREASLSHFVTIIYE